MNEIKISQIYYRSGRLSHNKYNIFPQNSVCKQEKAAPQTEVPKGNGNKAFSVFLSVYPLNKKSHKKHKLTCKTNR